MVGSTNQTLTLAQLEAVFVYFQKYYKGLAAVIHPAGPTSVKKKEDGRSCPDFVKHSLF
jgi:hypothetical protein